MPTDPEQERTLSCDGKVRHPTQEAAGAARHNSRVHRLCQLNVYPCRYCEGWHLGHANGSKKWCLRGDAAFNEAVAEWVEKFSGH